MTKQKKKKKITSGNLQIEAPICSQPTAVDHSCQQQSLGRRRPTLLSTSQGITAITRENPLFFSIRSKTQAAFDLCSTDTHVRAQLCGTHMHISLHSQRAHTTRSCRKFFQVLRRHTNASVYTALISSCSQHNFL